MHDPGAEDWPEIWAQEQRGLQALAYRILGSWADAEDAVAEAAARVASLSAAQRARVRSWPAYFTQVVTRRAIDVLRSAAHRRESYPGPWLPEPIASEDLPEDAAARRDIASIGMLHLMEQLRPEDRAAFVLRHALDLPYPQIAEILGTSPANARQMVSRAGRRLEVGRPPRTDRARVGAALTALVDAVAHGDVERTISLLSDDVTLWADGGGVVQAARNPLFGPERVARFLVGIAEASRAEGREMTAEPAVVNGESTVIVTLRGRRKLLHVEVGDGGIRAVRMIANPEKLGRILHPVHRARTIDANNPQ